MLLPDVIADLVFRGRWHNLVSSASWPHPWWRGWPDVEWATQQRNLFWKPDVEFAPTPAQLHVVARNLRMWAPHILEADDESRLDLEQTVRILDSWHFSLADPNATMQSTGSGRQRRYTATFLLRVVIAAFALRDKAKLKEVVAQQLLPLMPPGLRDLATQALGTHWHIPRFNTRLCLMLDCALMLHRRHTMDAEGPLAMTRYGFADSSPQGDRDWLISKVRCIPTAELGAVFAATVELTADAAEMEQARRCPSDDEPELPPATLDRKALFRVLKENAMSLTCVPTALGYGRTSLMDKCGALLYSYFLEVGLPNLAEFLSSFSSFTTDMGTELGLPEVSNVNFLDLLPRWICDGALLADTDAVGSELHVDFFYMWAMPVAGVLHILANASKDVHRCLVHWTWFYGQLKTVESLICVPHKIGRFLETCVVGTAYASYTAMFRRKQHKLYDKRWQEVYDFCRRLDPKLEILAAAWDSNKFLSGMNEDDRREDEDGEASLSPGELTATLNTKFFRAYVNLVTLLGEVSANLAKFAEQCPCHRHLQADGEYVPIERRKAEFGEFADSGNYLSCPNRGCNAPEFADGMVFDFLEAQFQQVLANLAVRWKSQLSEIDWSELLLEFSKGKSHLAYVLTVKLQNWRELPWFLCVLAHVSEDRARVGASQILEKFDSCSAAAANHRLTLKFCERGGILRAQLEQFIDGYGRRALEPLYTEICRLRFIPVTEREIEAPHSIVMRDIQHKHHGPVSISSRLRYSDVCSRYLSSEERFGDLAKQAAITKSMARIPKMLGVDNHPWWRRLPRDATTSSRIQCLGWILYRCDEKSQFGDMSSAIKAHTQAAKKRRTQEIGTLKKVKHVLNADRVLGYAATEHFREIAKSDAIFSMPLMNPLATGPKLAGLRQHLSTSNACADAAETGFDLDTDGDVATGDLPCGDDIIFFRIVHKKPNQQKLQKRPTAAGKRFGQGDVAIQVLDVAESAAGGDAVTLSVGRIEAEKSVILSGFGADVAWLRKKVFEHAEMSHLTYSFRGVDLAGPECALASRIADGLLQEAAFPGSKKVWRDEPTLRMTLCKLEEIGYVKQIEGAWQCTQDGLTAIRPNASISAGRPCFEPRTFIPLQDRTPFELLVGLLDAGMQWRALPVSGPQRAALPVATIEDGKIKPEMLYTGQDFVNVGRIRRKSAYPTVRE